MLRLPAEARNFSLLQNLRNASGIYQASYSVGRPNMGCFFGGRSSSSIELATFLDINPSLKKKAWKYTSTPLYVPVVCAKTTFFNVLYT